MERSETTEDSLVVDLNKLDWEAVFRAFKILSLLPSKNESNREQYDEWIISRHRTPEFEIAMRLLFARLFVMESMAPMDFVAEEKERYSVMINQMTELSLTSEQR